MIICVVLKRIYFRYSSYKMEQSSIFYDLSSKVEKKMMVYFSLTIAQNPKVKSD